MIHTLARWFWYRHAVPIPWRLPYGGWMLAYPDAMGAGLLGNYEPGIWRWLRGYVRPGMVCVDAGANQGFHTILMARLVGRDGVVLAVEPVAEEAAKLRRNLALNHLSDRVHISECALGREVQRMTLYVGPASHRSRSSLAALPAEVPLGGDQRDVAVSSLDAYLSEARRFDVLKVDIEGGERDLLRGGRQTIARFHPAIIMEVADVATRQFGYPASEIICQLQSMRYRVFEPEPDGKLIPFHRRDTYRTTVVALPLRVVR